MSFLYKKYALIVVNYYKKLRLNKPAPHYKNLDALRFYAVLAVFLFHYYNMRIGDIDGSFCRTFVHIFKGAGYLGVDFFFTLSGFLITSILLLQGGFDLVRFYGKRFLRIVPLYALVVAAAYCVLPLIYQQKISLPPMGYVLSFTANYFYAVHGDSYFFAVTILWSIAVEAQFYLLWGAVMRIASKYLYMVIPISVMASLIIKYILFGKCSLYYLTDTYIPDFMIGAIGAKLIAERTFDISTINNGLKVFLYIAAAAAFLVTPLLSDIFWWRIVCNCIYAILATGIIMDQCLPNSLINAGGRRLIDHMGKVSYGIYCFQGFLLPLYARILLPHLMETNVFVRVFVVPAVLFIITGVLASLSYRYFESYFLRLKEKV